MCHTYGGTSSSIGEGCSATSVDTRERRASKIRAAATTTTSASRGGGSSFRSAARAQSAARARATQSQSRARGAQRRPAPRRSAASVMAPSAHQGSDDDREDLTSTTDTRARRAEGASADTGRSGNERTAAGGDAATGTFATRLAGRSARFGEDVRSGHSDDRR